MNNLMGKLQVGYSAKVPLMCWGVPGVAKTAIINQWAKLVLKMRVITLHLSQMEAPDLLGLPKALKNGNGHKKATSLPDGDGNIEVILTADEIEQYKTHYIKPAWWPNEPVILFLDELNRAQRFEINAVHQLVLEGRLFMNVLPEGSYVVSACNPQTQEEIGLTPFGDAFWDRWAHIQVRTASEAWINWARKNDIDNSIVDFIDSRPDTDKSLTLNSRTMNFDEILKNIHPTPRSWEMASKVVAACEELGGEFLEAAGWPILEGLLGRQMAQTYRGFHASADKPLDPKELLAYTSHQVPIDPKNPAKGMKQLNPADDYTPERLSVRVRQKLEQWGKRGDNKIAIMKSSIQSAAEEIAKEFIKKGGSDYYSKNMSMMQADFGNFFEALSLCPASVQAAFMQEASSADIWSNIITIIPYYYVDKWLNDLPDSFSTDPLKGGK